jgi:hypothetical protein
MIELFFLILFIQTFLNFILILRTYDTYHETMKRLIDNNEKIVLTFLDYYNNYYEEEEEDDDEEEEESNEYDESSKKSE